jgi:hypothetical protein
MKANCFSGSIQQETDFKYSRFDRFVEPDFWFGLVNGSFPGMNLALRVAGNTVVHTAA